MNILSRKLGSALLFCAAILMGRSASANPVTWVGTNGVSATTNWSDSNNWVSNSGAGAAPSAVHETPVSDAANFDGNTAVSSPGLTTINVDGAYGTPGSGFAQSYGAFFGFTNGYHTVTIQPGVIWSIQSSGSTPSNGTQGLGFYVGPQQVGNNSLGNNTTPGTGAYTNYTTITGLTGMLYCDGGASASASFPGGLRVEGAS